MSKNYFLTQTWKLWLCLIGLLTTVQFASASDLWSHGPGSVDASQIRNGYIVVEFPIFDGDDNDEGSDHGSYFSLKDQSSSTEYRILNISGNQEDQSDKWTNFYTTASRNGSNTVCVIATTVNGNIEVGTNYSGNLWYGSNKVSGSPHSNAKFKVYLSQELLASGKSFTPKFHLQIDYNNGSDFSEDHETSAFSVPTFATPTISSSMNATTPGMYDVSFNVNNFNEGSYSFEDNLSGATALSSVPKTLTLELNSTKQNKTLYFWHKVVNDCGNTVWIKRTATVTIPAYQIAENFEAVNVSDVDNTNADTKLTWNISGDESGEYGNFEIQRSTDQGFATNIKTLNVTYNKNTTSYSVVDRTSEENLNTTVYYRISRQNPSNWKYANYAAVTQKAEIVKSMSHKGIKADSVKETIDTDNNVTITWDFDDGNVISENSKIVIKRVRLDNQQTDLTELDFKINTKSYTEELTAMCKEFHYSVYVKPGNVKYATQEPVEAKPLNQIVPVNFGKISKLEASKGYFSNRVELEWDLVEGAAETFSIQRSEYGKNEFKQLDTKPAFESAKEYTYTDITGTPGVVYEYRIAAMTSCASGPSTVYSPSQVGFRTPTGDFYGRVTFESGQAEEGVEINVTTEDNISSNALVFAIGDTAQITNGNLLKDNTAVTLQAWVAPQSSAGTQKIISKENMYELGINNDQFYFKAGNDTVSLDTVSVTSFMASSAYIHLTGVYDGATLKMYINGNLLAETTAGTVTGNSNPVLLGAGTFAGNIDEVRIWSIALDSASIIRDYNRYIVGDESGLLAYYTFNYITVNEFYDISYTDSEYHSNHGVLKNNTAISALTPTTSQLGYKGITRVDGSYEVRAVPYKGNGTAYYLVPKLGTHQFESQKEVRYLSAEAQSHTVNFTDKSSFKVTGTIYYAGGTVPVKGVQFQVDGITVMNKGNIVTTNNDGEFEINVPIGIHEVKAVKNQHTFENEGKITDPQGNDLNYQEEKRSLLLYDNTTIRFIGRIAGGTKEETYPLGHSLSTNNLGDGVTLTLEWEGAGQVYGHPSTNGFRSDSVLHVPHYQSTHDRNFGIAPDSTTVVYSGDYYGQTIIVHPSKETGEFAVNVIPEADFKLKLKVPGYVGFDSEVIQGGNFANSIIEQYEKHEVETDSIWSEELKKYKPLEAYVDEAPYHAKLNYSVRTRADIKVEQAKGSDISSVVPYFGLKEYVASDLVGNKDTITLWDETAGYTFAPNAIYQQGNTTLYKISLYEPYPYYEADGVGIVNEKSQEVPVQESDINIKNKLAKDTTIVTDSTGIAVYKFTATSFDPGNPSQRIDITMADNATVQWGLDVICIGARNDGNNFVTNGPSNVLMVLRDPPGSQSQSFLEAGLTVTKSSTYSGSLSQVGNEELTTYAGVTTITMTGAPGAMTGGIIEAENDAGFKLEHEEKYTGEDKEETSYTTTIRYATSTDPGMVGADADIYIGESTNLLFSETDILNFVSTDKHNSNLQTEVMESGDTKWKLVRSKGLGIAQQFATTFAYSQQHIIDVLIPQLEEARNNVLGKYDYYTYKSYTDEQLQALADQKNELVIVSKLEPGHLEYGKTNTNDVADRYRYFYPATYAATTKRIGTDTIQSLNQSIKRWEDVIAKNEQAKAYAIENRDKCLLKNYSFQGGADIEYTEQYSTTNEHTSSWEVTIDLKAFGWIETKVMGTGISLKLEEGGATTQSGNISSSASREHSKGFTLSDDASNNYFSVDVFHEPKWNEKTKSYEPWERDDENYDDGNLSEGMVGEGDIKAKDSYSTFIFSTRGGATSCPYEDEVVTQYFEPGLHVLSEKTIQIEQPGIIIAPTKLINVPSGNTGNFKLTLYNNATYNADIETILLIDDASNTRGLKFYIDGAPIGNGRYFVIPAGSTVEKTLEVGRGVDMQYDDVKLILKSNCDDIADTISFSIHFTPSCTELNLRKPATAWVYNTKLDTLGVNGVPEHYMNVTIDGFDQNYDNFHHIELQRKTASQSDAEWRSLVSFYANDSIFKVDSAAVAGAGIEKIKESDRGSIFYKLFMDGQLDQRYDVRAVSVCMVNGQPLTVDKVTAESEIHSGIKDMYNPRLFGAAQPADGVLDVGDEIQLNFNEPIAQGLLTKDNFQVVGVRNGSVSDHSTSVRFDGANDYLYTEFSKNLQGKSITIEAWVQPDMLQNATIFSHGNVNESMELSLRSDNKLQVKVGGTEVSSSVLDYSPENPNYADGSWAHVALVYDVDSNRVSAFYNYKEVISQVPVTTSYAGIGNMVVGKSIAADGANYAGKMHNLRIWEKVVNDRNLQLNSLLQLAGIEEGLLGYYPMNEGRGETLEDKARGATLLASGTEWSLPDGFAAQTNGNNYLKLSASSFAFTQEMDYTVEFWFKAEENQVNATIISAGSGETGSIDPQDGFAIGFDKDGNLTFTSNELTTVIEGAYNDNNWHHIAISVDRTKAKGQIYMDGNLTNYIDATTMGGIASSYIFVGARGWYREGDASTLVVDNYYKGMVDDVRFWELYKNEKMVRENNNVKLTGKEFGLVHYYPFDKYEDFQNQKFLDFTNKDMRISHTENPEKDEFTVVNGTTNTIRTNIIAPLKDAGPVADLDFDFVVNNDALIITLKEQEYRIAKTIITFTVYDVRDLNGNSIISPITWSAYIDRNQLRWSEDKLDIKKPVYEPMEFTVRAVNNGGTIQRYTIDNVPSWLDVTPSSGSLGPKSYEEITFSINEGLNVGSYEEVIYLTNEDNVPEALALNITVEGEKPNWTVDPSKYQYNMSIFGKLRFNNIFSADKEDMIAAFSNGECVGVVTSTYNKIFDMWYALLTVYSNDVKGTSDLEFRMWDASTGKTYKAIPANAIRFVNDAIVGDVDEPVIFDGKEIFYQNIHLTPGWNWVSFNLTDEKLSSVNNTLASGNWTKDDIVKSKDHFDSYSPQDKMWKGSLTRNNGFNNTAMFMIKASSAQTLNITGGAIDNRNAVINVKGGEWNYIGYIPSVNTTVKEALAGYNAGKGDIVKSQNGFAMYSRNEWVGSLTYMEANKGYMLYRSAADATSFIYPSGSGVLSSQRRARAVDNGMEAYNYDFAENMSIVATADILQNDDVIQAYINGELRGSGKFIADEKALNFIAVSGNEEGAPVRFELKRNDKVIASSSTTIRYASNSINGTIDNPVELEFGVGENNIVIYPNPFITTLYVEIPAEEGAEMSMIIKDITGRALINESQTAHDGINQVMIDGSALTTGVYLLQVTVDGITSTHKIEKR